jgi:hypothetical protein
MSNRIRQHAVQLGFVALHFLAAACAKHANPGADALERATSANVVAQSLATPTVVSLSASADAFIAQATPTFNFGNSTDVDVTGTALTGWQAGLVKFDPAAISAAVGSGVLQSARLDLTIASASLGWGNSRLSVNRMVVPWTENGVTWLCANDTDQSVLGKLINNCTSANSWGIEWWSFLPHLRASV